MSAPVARAAPPRVRPVRASGPRLALFVLATLARLWAAVKDHGTFWPDEIFQTLEPAHHFAFGWGLMTREMREGSRSWLLPGLLGIGLKLASLLGVHTASGLVLTARVAMALVSAAGVWFTMALAARLAGERAAILAGLLASMCPPLFLLAYRCLPEVVSATLVVLAAWLLLAHDKRRAAFAGALLTVTAFLRYPNGLLVMGFLLLLLAQERREDARAFLMAAAITAILGGLLDAPTLGWPFHSLWTFLRVNLHEGRMKAAGETPFSFYEARLTSSLGVVFGLLLVGLAFAWRRARGLILVTVAFVVAHSLAPQKELRFILPVLPVGLAVAAVGLSRLTDGLQRGAAPMYALGLLAALDMGWLAHTATRADLGAGTSDTVIWDAGSDYLRVTEEAGASDDLCGIIYASHEPRWTGGYTYLHRKAPIYFEIHPATLAAANYLITAKNERPPPHWKSVFSDGAYALLRRDGACSSPPDDWAMNLP